ncbi:MAG TPA: hypothetical protein VM869_06110, partial [Enhygromyxa sp.]|nr:hypothetical protein [Enhygromyxa sp.]
MKVAGKLTALLGLPLLLLFSIFASGVYCGAVRADRVVELEQQWFGIEPPEGRLLDEGEPGATDDGGGADDTPDEPPKPEPNVEQPEPPKPEPKPTTEPPKPIEPAKPEPTEQSSLVAAKAEPVGAELRSRFEEPRVVRVKIMVDPALVVAREDWLGTIAELFEATRISYERLFGIDLQLHGVVVWDDAVGADAAALLSDLAARDRDGADVMLGLLARAQPSDFTAARWTADVSGDHALVFADLQQTDRYYRNLLRALALLFGAEPALDSEAKQLGSFMSDGAVNNGAPVLDPENRGRVIINKRRPIAAPVPA